MHVNISSLAVWDQSNEPFQRAMQTPLPHPLTARTSAAESVDNNPHKPCLTHKYLSIALPSASRNTAEVFFVCLFFAFCRDNLYLAGFFSSNSCLAKVFVPAGKHKLSLEAVKLFPCNLVSHVTSWYNTLSEILQSILK